MQNNLATKQYTIIKKTKNKGLNENMCKQRTQKQKLFKMNNKEKKHLSLPE